MPKIVHTGDPVESLRIEGSEAGAVVHLAPGRGGLVTRFSARGEAVLYLDETTLRDPQKNVRGGVPVLFPIAGKLPGDRYEALGEMRTMKQHGFARNLPWAVLDENEAEGSVTLGLEASEETFAMYPFDFALRTTVRLLGETLEIEQEILNRGGVPMPIQPGLHPYFFVPESSKSEARVDTDATLSRDNQTGEERPLTSPVSFAGREVDWALLGRVSNAVVLRRPPLSSIRVDLDPLAEALVVWTLPGRDFICVEPWRAKPGVLSSGSAPVVAPRASERSMLRLSLARA